MSSSGNRRWGGVKGRPLCWLLCLLLAASLVWAAPQRKTTAAGRTRTSRTTRQNAAAKKKSASAKVRASGGKAARKGKRTASKARPSWRRTQMQPAPERYREIQQALIAKGYLQGEATGVWDQASIAALRRFQQDQRLDATGRLDSLSLIALGLGPQYPKVSPPKPSP